MIVRNLKAICFWAGDSRLYLYRQKRIEQISVDQSLVQQLVNTGVVSREQAESHPASNVISRAVGAQFMLNLDFEAVDLRVADRLLLCSDGLYKELSVDEIAVCLDSSQPVNQVVSNLYEAVMGKAASDNFSFILVEIAP